MFPNSYHYITFLEKSNVITGTLLKKVVHYSNVTTCSALL